MDLDKLEAVAIAATPGPWGKSDGEIFSIPTQELVISDECHGWMVAFVGKAPEFDENFVVAFNPAVALELVAEIKRLRRVNDDYLHIIHEHQEQLAKYEQATPSRPLKRWAKGWQQCAKCDALHIELPDDSAFMRAHREAERRKNQEGGAK